MKNRKLHLEARLTDTYKTWQGWQVGNRTFDEELRKVDIRAIRELLEESAPNEPSG